jgi:hypothetical protein
MISFEYPEDREYFANLLANGDVEKLENFADLFDFEHPAIKREKFNKIKKKVLKELVEKHDGECQLRIHPDCNLKAGAEVDHIIPLSSNELNKKLRHMTRFSAEKVQRQSFGSNNARNFTLACERCNAFKKHKFFESDLYTRLLF